MPLGICSLCYSGNAQKIQAAACVGIVPVIGSVTGMTNSIVRFSTDSIFHKGAFFYLHIIYSINVLPRVFQVSQPSFSPFAYKVDISLQICHQQQKTARRFLTNRRADTL